MASSSGSDGGDDCNVLTLPGSAAAAEPNDPDENQNTEASLLFANNDKIDTSDFQFKEENLLSPNTTAKINYEETYQGPHKWRKYLKHVPSTKRKKKNPNNNNTSNHLNQIDGDQGLCNDYTAYIDNDVEDSEMMEADMRMMDMASAAEYEDMKEASSGEDLSHENLHTWKQEYGATSYRKGHRHAQVAGQSSQIPVTIRRQRSFQTHDESAFTRQVVNSGHNTNTSRKKASPSSSFRQSNSHASANSGRRTAPQPGALTDISTNTNTDLTKKRIERVQRARLYLLQQTGPNSFLIGGDSPDHKFRVIIGEQACSCGRAPHCVHVLFVMLRVFKVGENDPCLWSRTLKNYEVENLFRIYYDKRRSRITKRRPSQRKKEVANQVADSEDNNGVDESSVDNPADSTVQAESDAGSVREEEDTCPICLLEMLEGESLICCENGCHNRLHHHCIAIWFEECRRQNDPLNCPLCRAQWKSSTVEIKSTAATTEVPPNTRASSPQPMPTEEDRSRLPYAEPIPQELQDTAAPWIEALGPDLVSCLLSRNWSVREAGLKHLSKEVMATLIKGAGEGRSGAVVSPVRRAATRNMLQTACNILAYMCADPVYRVFVASLRSMRTLLAYTPCRDSEQRQRLQTILKPIIEAIILKCTDGNRRTSQLSLSTLVELGRGQDGELAVGREILNPGAEGLDGLNYLLRCVTEDYILGSTPWQWLLGRLYVLDRLLEEFPTQFLPGSEVTAETEGGAAEAASEEGAAAASGGEEKTYEPGDDIGASNYNRLMSVAHFSVKAVCSTHMRIARMSRRVFLLSAKLGAHVQKVITELKNLLSQIDTTSVASLHRKLDRIVEDFQLSEKIIHELMHGSGRKSGRLDSPNVSPDGSPVSTPRCNSPIHGGESCLSEALSDRSVPEPSVPPNSPCYPKRRRKLVRSIPRRSFREAHHPSAPPPTSESSPEKNSNNSNSDQRRETETKAAVTCVNSNGPDRLGSSSPPIGKKSNLPLRRKTIERDKIASKRNSASNPNVRRKTHDGSILDSNSSPTSQKVSHQYTQDIKLHGASEEVIQASTAQRLHSLPSPSAPSTSAQRQPSLHSQSAHSQSAHSQSAQHQSAPSPLHNPPLPSISITDTTTDHDGTGTFSPVGLSDVDENGVTKDFYKSNKDGADNVEENFSLSDEADMNTTLLNTPNAKTANSSPPCRCACHETKLIPPESTSLSPKSGTVAVPNTPESGTNYHTAEHESMSSDDFLDFSQEATPSKDDKPVSFKSEVAESPKSSPSHSVRSGASSKSDDCGTCKEEVEREEAEALAKALDVSSLQLPSPVVPGLTPSTKEEVITIRIQPDDESGESNAPSMYMEGTHWQKGPLLGTGAYSSCYQARDVRTGVIMAVKQISFCRNSPQEQEKVVDAIGEEIHMMARLSHPNIVRILGATKQGCHFNMFVEWMPGGSLAYLLGEYGVFTEAVIVSYTRQLLRGLAYLHDNHILHRDLKGANILVDSTGQLIRIGDFGASARLASQATGAGEFQGQLLGTIAFMAPEVLRGESYGRACDIWSVGCVMIEMATTKPPWNATDISNHLALIFKIASSVSAPPIPESLSPPVKDVMKRCLEQASADRPSSKDLLLHPVFTQLFASITTTPSRTHSTSGTLNTNHDSRSTDV